jgi:hypothetical protein
MPVPANLVHQESVSTGTGNFTLTQVNGKNNFATAFTTGGSNVFDYFISNRDAAQWERGTGSMDTTAVLIRGDIIETSAGTTSAIDFSAGTKDVTNDVPARIQVRTLSTVASTGLFAVFDSTQGNLIKVAGTPPIISTTVASSGLFAVFDTTAGNVLKAAPTPPITSLTSGTGITISGTTISAQTATTDVVGVTELAEDTEYRTNTAGNISLTPAKVWSAAGSVALAAAGTVVTVDMGTFLSLASRAMAANETLGNPTNPKVGQQFIVSVASTTTRTLTLGTNYKLWAGVEIGPYNVTTAEKLYVCGFIESSTGAIVTSVGRTTSIT